MQKESGFSLVELMVVVAIIGVLASVAIPSFMRNKNNAKTAEVPVNIKGIFEGAIAYYGQTQFNKSNYKIKDPKFPNSAGLTPGFRCCKGDTSFKCDPSNKGPRGYDGAKKWGKTAWLNLQFKMQDRHLFRYQYKKISNDAFQAIARGDLDCDGNESLYFRVGKAVNGEVNGTELLREGSEE